MNGKHNILIVEDSSTLLEMLKRSLEKAGYGVQTAETPGEAWKILTTSDIDLVASDILLGSKGVETGYHLLRRIKGSPELEHIPVILMSSKRKEKMAKVTSKRMGAVDFLKKPFEMTELIKKIKEFLGN